MQYGLPYKGSKSKIATEIVGCLPAAETFVDLFAGGCAVTHAAILSGKYRRFIVNDLQGQYPRLFVDAINGHLPNPRVYTREEFETAKATDAIAAACWSFGNNCKNYLWSTEIEQAKLTACRMILSNQWTDRFEAYKRYIRAAADYLRRPGEPERLQSLESLQRLQSLEITVTGQSLEITVTGLDYSEVEIPDGAVIYADPPYINTDEYATEFDSETFHAWLRSVDFPVFVSEYTMPDDFVPVWQRRNVCTLGAGNRTRTTEKLFLRRDLADRWRPTLL